MIILNHYRILTVGKYKNVPEGFEQTFERWCHDQVCTLSIPQGSEESFKESTRSLSVKIRTVRCLYDYDLRTTSETIKRSFPEAIILNDLPEDEALAIWREIL